MWRKSAEEVRAQDDADFRHNPNLDRIFSALKRQDEMIAKQESRSGSEQRGSIAGTRQSTQSALSDLRRRLSKIRSAPTSTTQNATIEAVLESAHLGSDSRAFSPQTVITVALSPTTPAGFVAKGAKIAADFGHGWYHDPSSRYSPEPVTGFMTATFNVKSGAAEEDLQAFTEAAEKVNKVMARENLAFHMKLDKADDGHPLLSIGIITHEDDADFAHGILSDLSEAVLGDKSLTREFPKLFLGGRLKVEFAESLSTLLATRTSFTSLWDKARVSWTSEIGKSAVDAAVPYTMVRVAQGPRAHPELTIIPVLATLALKNVKVTVQFVDPEYLLGAAIRRFGSMLRANCSSDNIQCPVPLAQFTTSTEETFSRVYSPFAGVGANGVDIGRFLRHLKLQASFASDALAEFDDAFFAFTKIVGEPRTASINGKVLCSQIKFKGFDLSAHFPTSFEDLVSEFSATYNAAMIGDKADDDDGSQTSDESHLATPRAKASPEELRKYRYRQIIKAAGASMAIVQPDLFNNGKFAVHAPRDRFSCESLLNEELPEHIPVRLVQEVALRKSSIKIAVEKSSSSSEAFLAYALSKNKAKSATFGETEFVASFFKHNGKPIHLISFDADDVTTALGSADVLILSPSEGWEENALEPYLEMKGMRRALEADAKLPSWFSTERPKCVLLREKQEGQTSPASVKAPWVKDETAEVVEVTEGQDWESLLDRVIASVTRKLEQSNAFDIEEM